MADGSGARLVGRVAARVDGRLLVTLPDGTIGWADREVPSETPFRPWTVSQVRNALLQGPYGGFHAVEREHHLVLTQGRPAFAEQCADQLEQLYRGLVDALRSGGIDARAPEFPLVIVIFRDEANFRSHRRVDPDVLAYYEAYSNRIYLFESSTRDELAPDLAALRRPQTVAHEGVHQILQNVGVQHRLAPWPPWLVEGLAEYYAPATSMKLAGRERFGQVNPFHMATLIDLGDPQALWAHLASAPSGRLAPAWHGRDRRSGWIDHLIRLDHLEPTDHALSWALTHYLALRRAPQLKAYIQLLNRLDPLQDRSDRQHALDFRRAFGDPSTLALQVDQHLLKLRYDPVPFYALMIRRDLGNGPILHDALISQSPAMLDGWLTTLATTDRGPPSWQLHAYPSRNQARRAAETWLLSGYLP